MESSLQYAIALFTLSQEKDKVDLYHDELIDLEKLMKDNEAFLDILKCVFITLEERKTLIDQTFIDYEDDVKNFLKVLLDNHKLNSLYEIIDVYINLYNENKGIIKGKVYSTYPLSKEEIKRLEEAFYEKKKLRVILVNEIDESLIGGVRVILKDRIYDGSLKNKLENLKTSLKKEGETRR